MNNESGGENIHSRFQLGEWRVEPGAGTLTRDDESVRLEPKALEVLCYLAERPGELVTREALERDVWKGAVIGYDSVTAAVTKLRKALGDEVANPTYIATVPKRGYRLIAEVGAIDDSALTGAAESSTTDLSGSDRSSIPKAGLIVGVLLVGLLFATMLVQREQENHQAHGTGAGTVDAVQSIVVVPFTNLSDEADQSSFADGISDDIITDLSRLSGLAVSASNVSFSLNRDEIDPKALGEELGVAYALTGSIRRSGDQIRVNAQLVDTATGFQKWAERYDRRLEQVFAVQDELTEQIVKELQVRLTSQERQRLDHVHTANFDAYERFWEGRRYFSENTRASTERAKELYIEAIGLDGSYGRAYGALGYAEARSYWRGWTDNPNRTLDRALELARKGVELDGSVPQTHWSLGYVHVIRKEYEAARDATLRAIDVAPNYADAYGLLGLINNHLGEWERAVAQVKRGMTLNPYYTWDYLWNLGRAYYYLGQYDEAITALEEAGRRNENVVVTKLYLAACYVQRGRRDDAEWEIEQAQALEPNVTVAHIQKSFPARSDAHLQKLINDLRAAGLPE